MAGTWLCFAAYLVAARFISTHAAEEESRRVPMLLVFGCGMLAGAPFVGLPLVVNEHISLVAGMDSATWWLMVTLATTGGIYYTLMSFAVRYSNSANVALIGMVEMVLFPVFSNIAYPEPTTAVQITSQAVIGCSVLICEGWTLVVGTLTRHGTEGLGLGS